MQRSGLGAGPELNGRLVAQDPQRIASRTGGNGNGWIHRGTGCAIADGDVALLIHCATSRWMSSGAMDKQGNIAIGYSTSSPTVYPSIAVSTRAASDTLGILSNESTVKFGAGAQTASLHRWGDYASMVIDPSDDCTFWFTSEYLKDTGSFNWSTWISSFKISGCQ